MKPAACLAALTLACSAVPAAAQGRPIHANIVVEPLAWEGTAEVYPPGRTLRIGVRTKIDQVGNVVSESWPLELGEAKGMRRMRIISGQGTIERGGKTEPMPEDMATEEREQFEIYRSLQVAKDRAAEMAALGVTTFEVGSVPTTWFRIDRDGQIVSAVNEVHAVGGSAYQEFRFDGFWKSNGSIFPRHMEMLRDGKPFFTLDVAKFEAGAAH